MQRELSFTTDPIDESALTQTRQLPSSMGAVVCFSGVVRASEGGELIAGIEYEAFHEMAVHQFNLIFNAVEQKFPVQGIRLVHRIGFVPANQPSLWLEVICPHRAEAFAAAQWVVDAMKRTVPIWKKVIPSRPGSALAGARQR